MEKKAQDTGYSRAQSSYPWKNARGEHDRAGNQPACQAGYGSPLKRTKQPEPRSFSLPVQRSRVVGFASLRALSVSCETVRKAVETRRKPESFALSSESDYK